MTSTLYARLYPRQLKDELRHLACIRDDAANEATASAANGDASAAERWTAIRDAATAEYDAASAYLEPPR